MRQFIMLVFLLFSALGFAGVNLNTATEAELESLPGVGSKLASEIIAARPFQSVDDLKKVKGIGAAKFDKLKGLVEVGQMAEPARTAAPTTSTPSPSVAPTTPYSPPPSSPRSQVSTPHKQLAPNEIININTASLQDLEKLPGIGKKRAELIVQGRPYNSPEDIMKVKGIKQGIYQKIKDHISVH